MKHAFSLFYTLIKPGFSKNQSERAQRPLYIIIRIRKQPANYNVNEQENNFPFMTLYV